MISTTFAIFSSNPQQPQFDAGEKTKTVSSYNWGGVELESADQLMNSKKPMTHIPSLVCNVSKLGDSSHLHYK